MSKIVSEEERALTKEAIYEKTVQLIRKKGLRAITVDDIVNAVGIGKGSFFTYYPSKEVCLYEAISQWEKKIFSKIEEIMTSVYSEKDKAVAVLKEIYIAEDSLMTVINQTDKEILLRKLPAEYREIETGKSENNFQKALQHMNLNNQQMEVIALLTDCLNLVASNKNFSHSGKKEALDVLINAMADLIVSNECQ